VWCVWKWKQSSCMLYVIVCTVLVLVVISIISASLSSVTTRGTEHLPGPSVSVGRSAKCCIQMPFGVVSGVGWGMGVLDGVVIIGVEGAVVGVNLGRPIVTNWAFVAYLYGSAWTDQALIWHVEWGAQHWCMEWESTWLKGKEWILGFLLPLAHWFYWPNFQEKYIRLVCEKLRIFPYA